MVKYGDVPEVYGVTGEINNIKTVNCSTALTDPAYYKNAAPYLSVTKTMPVPEKPSANWGIADPNAVTGYQDQFMPTPYLKEGGQEDGTIEGFDSTTTNCPQAYTSGLPNLMSDGAGFSSPQEPQTTFQGLAPLTGAPIDTIGQPLTPESYVEPWPAYTGRTDMAGQFNGRGFGGRETFNVVSTGASAINFAFWLVSVIIFVIIIIAILRFIAARV